MKPSSQRRIDNVLGALREDVASARDLVGRRRQAYDTDRLLPLSAEAILGRIGEVAKILPDGVAEEIFGDDRAAWIGQRIVVDHLYHRLDYGEVWATIETDVAGLGERLSDRTSACATCRRRLGSRHRLGSRSR